MQKRYERRGQERVEVGPDGKFVDTKVAYDDYVEELTKKSAAKHAKPEQTAKKEVKHGHKKHK